MKTKHILILIFRDIGVISSIHKKVWFIEFDTHMAYEGQDGAGEIFVPRIDDISWMDRWTGYKNFGNFVKD